MNKLSLSVISMLAIMALMAPSMAQSKAQDIAQQQLLVDRFEAQPMQLLDVRSSEEYQQGHIKGAINISFDVISEHAAKLDKEQPIVVYCRSGRRAGIAIETLQQLGFTKLYHLEGDMMGWTEKDLPVITQP
ncbi:rhodanese-like domain-containing protein [Pseudoalteromonas sp. YIC-656]|uniref:rhodanese-like domain-containing protein n=1 Tax=Pseudoalteromonas pernae TaxID=3118054 RepID=UPI003242CA37